MLHDEPSGWERPENWQILPAEEAYYRAFMEQVGNDSAVRQKTLELLCRAVEVGDNAACAWTLHLLAQRWNLVREYADVVTGAAQRLALEVAPPTTSSESCNRRGILLFNGGYTDTETEQEAAAEFERGMRGSAAAMNNFAFLLERGQGGQQRDLARARKLYEAAIDRGSSAAYHNLAAMVQHGLGGPASLSEAASLLLRSVTAGGTMAGHALGYLVLSGQVGAAAIAPHDPRELLLRAAPPEAAPHLRELYNHGPGSGLSECQRKRVIQLSASKLPAFSHWRAPLYDLDPADEQQTCCFCRQHTSVIATSDSALGCLQCLAARRFRVDSDWRLEGAELAENDDDVLAYTPAPATCSLDAWPSHCSRAAVFVGTWNRDDFHYHATGASTGDGLFLEAAERGGDHENAEEMGVAPDRQGACWYVFSCFTCKKLMALHDLD